MAIINWEDFEKVDIRVGKIVEVSDFPEARKPCTEVMPPPISRILIFIINAP